MSVKITSRELAAVAVDRLVLPAGTLAKGAAAPYAGLDEELGGSIAAAYATGSFTGAAGESLAIPSVGAIQAPVVVLTGVGAAAPLSEEDLRRACAVAAKQRGDAGKVAIALPEATEALGTHRAAEAAVLGDSLARYRFLAMRGKGGEKAPVPPKLELVCASEEASEARKGAKAAEAIASGVNTARDLGNLPGNFMTPSDMAKRARAIARETGLKASVLDEKRMAELGMGSLLSVSEGSVEPAKLIVLEHGKKKRGKDTICLVGKGLTFDTGGISIKPSGDMDKMRYDMCGGGAVIGAMEAIARMDLPLHVVGIVPSSENMPDGKATKPGDVVTAMNGKTIEVLNTDAEGRLILADALCYAQRYKPGLIIDLATLTGAVLIALGRHMAGALGTSDEAIEELGREGAQAGEPVWRLPLGSDYDSMITGGPADLKNIGGREAGTVTAAQFLQHFVADIPWVHLDIAGMAWDDPKRAYNRGTGATGFGVRLLARFLEARAHQA